MRSIQKRISFQKILLILHHFKKPGKYDKPMFFVFPSACFFFLNYNIMALYQVHMGF